MERGSETLRGKWSQTFFYIIKFYCYFHTVVSMYKFSTKPYWGKSLDILQSFEAVLCALVVTLIHSNWTSLYHLKKKS